MITQPQVAAPPALCHTFGAGPPHFFDVTKELLNV